MDRHELEYTTIAEPLLESSAEDYACREKSKKKWKRNFVLLHFAIALFYILTAYILVLNALQTHHCPEHGRTLYSPANEAVEYKSRIMEMDPERFVEGNPFVGEPRLELDEAWNNLLRNIQISVKPHEFDLLQPQLNRSSLRLPEGSYIIRLKVFHKLHCLKWIRKWIHRDHYWPDISGYELHERRWHIEHCLESLRLDTMCRPSLAPATFHFVDRNASDDLTANGDHVENCADWDTLQRWADQRRVDLNAIDRLSLKEGD